MSPILKASLKISYASVRDDSLIQQFPKCEDSSEFSSKSYAENEILRCHKFAAMELDSNLVSARKFHSRRIPRVAGGSASKRSYSKWLLGFSELFVRNIVLITGILGFCKLLRPRIIEYRNLISWSFQLFASALHISPRFQMYLRTCLYREIFYINFYTHKDYVHRKEKNDRDNKIFSKYQSHKWIIEASSCITREISQSYYPMPWDAFYIILFMLRGDPSIYQYKTPLQFIGRHTEF